MPEAGITTDYIDSVRIKSVSEIVRLGSALIKGYAGATGDDSLSDAISNPIYHIDRISWAATLKRLDYRENFSPDKNLGDVINVLVSQLQTLSGENLSPIPEIQLVNSEEYLPQINKMFAKIHGMEQFNITHIPPIGELILYDKILIPKEYTYGHPSNPQKSQWNGPFFELSLFLALCSTLFGQLRYENGENSIDFNNNLGAKERIVIAALDGHFRQYSGEVLAQEYNPEWAIHLIENRLRSWENPFMLNSYRAVVSMVPNYGFRKTAMVDSARVLKFQNEGEIKLVERVEVGFFNNHPSYLAKRNAFYKS